MSGYILYAPIVQYKVPKRIPGIAPVTYSDHTTLAIDMCAEYDNSSTWVADRLSRTMTAGQNSWYLQSHDGNFDTTYVGTIWNHFCRWHWTIDVEL
jgi:hypothetical protein